MADLNAILKQDVQVFIKQMLSKDAPAKPEPVKAPPEPAVHELLRRMAEKQASDLFLTCEAPPHLKIDGVTGAIEAPLLKSGDVKALIYGVMSKAQIEDFEAKKEANLAYALQGSGRFRINVYYQRGQVAVVVRLIKSVIPTFEQLGLPPACSSLAMLKRGLVLFVGAAGSGKSTSLAAMIGYRSANAGGHILTVEDPIEFHFNHGRSLVDQREVSIDTWSFSDALRNAMREAPDVIVIGEIRDQETARHALSYAETGHLCLSTLHASNANQAIDRMINFFPDQAHNQLRMDLSLNLKGVISQRLLPSAGGKLVLASEVLLASAYVSELIQNGRIHELKEAMGKSTEIGMRTFDQSLYELYEAGRVSFEEALQNADSQTDFALRARLAHAAPSASSEFGGLTRRSLR